MWNISCSISFASTFRVISRKFWILLDSVYVNLFYIFIHYTSVFVARLTFVFSFSDCHPD